MNYPRPHFFGKPWNAPNCDNAVQAATPVGEKCLLCDRKIQPDDQGFIRPFTKVGSWGLAPQHRGCEMANSSGHFFGVCSCTGWEDTYEAGVELIHRDNIGTLRMVGP